MKIIRKELVELWAFDIGGWLWPLLFQNVPDQCRWVTPPPNLGEYLGVEAVWTMAAAEEPLVRRALLQLIYTLLARKPELLKPRLGQIGRVLVADSLKISQVGSATDLVKALTKLTECFPEVWGTKTHPLQRLRLLIERGSQGGPASYWQDLEHLLAVLPDRDLSMDTAANFLKAIRIGISSRQEPRSNATQAWGAYIKAFGKFIRASAPDPAFVQENFFPLARQFLQPSQKLQAWTSPPATTLSPTAWAILTRHPDAVIRKSVAMEWARLHQAVLKSISNSFPEVSKDYEKSQQSVATQEERWFTLVGTILRLFFQETYSSEEDPTLRDAVQTSSMAVLHGALDLLSRRNYKPFGAASLLQSAFQRCPTPYGQDSLIAALFPVNDSERLDVLVASPSSPYLVTCLDRLASTQPDRFQVIWNSLVLSTLKLDAASSISVVNQLISIPGATPPARANQQLQTFIVAKWLACAAGNSPASAWRLCKSTLAFDTATEESLAVVVTDLVQRLDVSQTCGPALQALELIADHKSTVLSHHSDADVALVTKLLSLAEMKDQDVAGRAAALQAHLDQNTTGNGPLVGIIQRNLEDTGASSIGYAAG